MDAGYFLLFFFLPGGGTAMPDDIKDEYRQHDPGKGWAGGKGLCLRSSLISRSDEHIPEASTHIQTFRQ